MNRICLLVGIFLFPILLVAQEVAFTFEPQKPQKGAIITISYNPNAPTAQLKNPQKLYLIETRYGRDFDQFPMYKKNDVWQVKFPLYEASITTFYVRSESGVDTNSDKHWEVITYDGNKPVKGAYYMRAFNHSDRLEPSELEALQLEDYRKEVLYYPEDLFSNTRLWAYELGKGADPEATFKKAQKLIDAVWKKNKDDYATYSSILYTYRQLGRMDTVEAFEQQVKQAFPNGKIAKKIALNKAFQEKDIATIEAYMAQNGMDDISSYQYRSIFLMYKDLGNLAKMEEWANRFIASDTYMPSRTYQTVARAYMDLDVQKALFYAEKAVESAKTEPIPQYSRMVAENQWVATSLDPDRQMKARNSQILQAKQLLGELYFKLNNGYKALEYLEEVEKYLTADVDSRNLLKMMGDAYMMVKDYERAYEIYFEAARKYQDFDEVQTNLKEAHVALRKPESAFPNVLAELNNIWANKPMPVFSVDDYYIENDPFADLEMTKKMAQSENKRIMIFVGGEWCTWCHALTRYFKQNETVAQMLQNNYIIMKVNYSQENENKAFLSQYPTIRGYPHLFILEQDGTFLHSQETGSLEEGIGLAYTEEVVMGFLKAWAPKQSRP